ncbi:MAG: hypothetical protein KDI36_13150, partial [Pseudomonadales bacterium]|nr:hypothetical protein [Pseudomonadales bacterium]
SQAAKAAADEIRIADKGVLVRDVLIRYLKAGTSVDELMAIYSDTPLSEGASKSTEPAPVTESQTH